MKTLLAFLIAAMVFLTTPMLASAARRGHAPRQTYAQRQMQRDRHHDSGRHDNRRQDHHHRYYDRGYDRHYNRRDNRDLRWELRETRHELYRVKQQRRHHHHYTYYQYQPALIIGVPPLVFLFDW